jgi:two-component system cell cycle sensor histidine kinase/response regulator CckA
VRAGDVEGATPSSLAAAGGAAGPGHSQPDGLESEQKFAKLFRISPHPIAITELETGKILELSDAFQRLFGYSRAEALGRTTFELGIWVDAGDRERVVASLRERGQVRDLEMRARTKDGRTLVTLLNAEPIELGNARCFLTVVQDVTARVEAERRRAELEAHLRQVHKMEALGTLAGGVAHDFNNLLGAIVMFAELIRIDAHDHDQIQRHLQDLSLVTQRAKEVVQQILTFSRQQTAERSPLRVAQVVREVVPLLRSMLPGLDIQVAISPGLPMILANATQIHQVLVNLAANAAHAMRDGGGRLSIGLDLLEAGAGDAVACGRRCVRLTVSDSGHGMDAETQERIFDPFFTTKPLGEGTGMGLAVVQGIVAEHEGSIRVESRIGVGSTFVVCLPEYSPPPPRPRLPE